MNLLMELTELLFSDQSCESNDAFGGSMLTVNERNVCCCFHFCCCVLQKFICIVLISFLVDIEYLSKTSVVFLLKDSHVLQFILF